MRATSDQSSGRRSRMATAVASNYAANASSISACAVTDSIVRIRNGYAATASDSASTWYVGTVSIVWRIRPATQYGSAIEFGRRSSR